MSTRKSLCDAKTNIVKQTAYFLKCAAWRAALRVGIKAGPRIGLSRITNLYPDECAILSRARCSAPYMLLDARRRICSAGLQGNRSSKRSWIALRCSGADPSASRKPCETLCGSRGLPQDGAARGEMIANRDVCVDTATQKRISVLYGIISGAPAATSGGLAWVFWHSARMKE